MDKYKVVIVDDDELSRDNLSFALGKDNRFSVEGIAHNGRQGRRLIAKIRPDLLFLDVEMPDTTGRQFLQAIRDSLTWSMKVFFYTAYNNYSLPAL